jgi:hypothetical protein
MRDPAVNAEVEEATAALVRYWRPFVRAGYFAPCRLDPEEVAFRHNTRLHVERLPDHILPPEMRELVLQRLSGAKLPPRKDGRYSGDEFRIRNRMIVVAIERICKRGFDPARNRERKSGRYSACQIVHSALARLGIQIAERTVEDIWNKRGVRANSPR